MIIQYIKSLFSKTDKDPLSVHQRYMKEKLPFVIRGGAKKLKAYKIWTDEYLLKKIGDKPVEVETSSNGIFNPDSPTANSDLIDMTVKTYLKKYTQNFKSKIQYFLPQVSIPSEADILLRDVVRKDLLKLVNSMRSRKRKRPLDSLLFLGNNNNVTPMHTDSYHNFYHLLDGEKEILLIPPRYTKQFKSYTKFNHLRIPDIKNIDYNKFPKMKGVPITTVHLKKGDLLYIPYNCWHQMRGCKGRNLAVALWF